MKPVSFDYHRPETVAAAVTLLDQLEDAKVLAGGQSLVPLMNYRLAAPAHLVDVSRLGELGRIEVTDEAVVVGAAVTHSELHASDAAAEAIPLLREAEDLIAHEVIRNRGTVCGSLAHADPSGELTAVLSLLGGSVVARSVPVNGSSRPMSCSRGRCSHRWPKTNSWSRLDSLGRLHDGDRLSGGGPPPRRLCGLRGGNRRRS